MNLEKSGDIRVFSKDIKDIKNELSICVVPNPVSVTVLAVHNKDESNNDDRLIHCHKGVPIGGYVYNSVDDTIAVSCMDHIHIGLIHISYIAKMNTAAGWSQRVPMPESVIKRYLTPMQKKRLFQFKERYKGIEPDVNFHYIQMLGAF